ncbi:hypothetical protein V2J09_000982 [Rumex salicifolius]
MVGALTVVLDSTHSCPCLCVDAMPSSTVSLMKGGGEMALCRSSSATRRQLLSRQTAVSSSLELGSSFVDAGKEFHKAVYRSFVRKQRSSPRSRVIVSELAGQYEDSFEDVKANAQSHHTSFVVSNNPGEGKRFLKLLVKEHQELAERVMTTRLHLYGKWIKKCNHAEIYNGISEENLELMRERLMETVIWPSDDTNTEKIG